VAEETRGVLTRLAHYDEEHPEELAQQKRLQQKALYWAKRGTKAATGAAKSIALDPELRAGVKKAQERGQRWWLRARGRLMDQGVPAATIDANKPAIERALETGKPSVSLKFEPPEGGVSRQ
jgi:hypothetical protein